MGKLLERHDVVFLQEVRGDAADSDLYARELVDHVVYTSHLIEGRHGGVMAIIKKSFLARFDDIIVQELLSGRVMRIMMIADDITLNFINLHLDPSTDIATKKDTLTTIFNHTDPSSMTSFLVGDYNVPDEAEGRFHPRQRRWTHYDRALGRWMGEMMTNFTELQQ